MLQGSPSTQSSTLRRIKHYLHRLLALLWIAVLAGIVGNAYAHPDPPAPPTLEDWIVLKELNAESDQDDGFNGKSEYFLRIKMKHAGHAHADSEIVVGFEVDWDAINPDTGKPYDSETPPSLPLVGKNGAISSAINSLIDRECSPSESWELSFELKESNSLELADIFSTLGQALEKMGTNLPLTLNPRLSVPIVLGGPLLGALGAILDKLFNTMENLGIENPNWTSGEGDTGTNVVSKSGDAAHYSFRMEKHVVVIPGKRHECEATVTNPPSYKPEHSFGEDMRKAEFSWESLRHAALRIDAVDLEPGETNDPLGQVVVQEQRQALRELIAPIGRSVALAELEEAQLRPDLVPQEQLDSARERFQIAEYLSHEALAQTNTAPLLQALQLYQHVFSGLASALHESQASALDYYQAGDEFVIGWQHGGLLQMADSPAGPWTDLAYAISPFRAPMSSGSRFFRVIK